MLLVPGYVCRWVGEQPKGMLLGQLGKFEGEVYIESELLRIECTQGSPETLL